MNNFLVEKVVSVRLVVTDITHIGSVMQHARDLCRIPSDAAARTLSFVLDEFPHDRPHAVALQIPAVNHTNRLRLFGLYDIRIAHALIPENVSVAVEHFIHTADLLSGFYSFGNFPAFVLSECSHDCKS